MQALLDILLPPRCALCASPQEPLCPDCLAGLPYLTGPSCARCGRPTALPVGECRECGGRRLEFQRAAAAIAYEGGGRELVRHLKSGRRRALAGPAGATIATLLGGGGSEVVCWVPGDWWRTMLYVMPIIRSSTSPARRPNPATSEGRRKRDQSCVPRGNSRSR